jgi:hypothetical protein
LEEYVALIDTNTSDLDDIPSDIKTVAYFVQSADVTGGVQDALANATAELGLETSLDSGGLVRRSLDRAATVEAANTGSLSLLNQTGDLLAPEVVGIEFSYWDGVTWLLEWSSDTYEELPLAISVSLTLKAEGQEESGVVSSDGLLGSARVFTHIVRLPLAKPIDQTDEEDLSEVGL